MTEPVAGDLSNPVRDHGDAGDALHRAGRAVAEALGLSAEDLVALRRAREMPTWTSNLRVAELAYDSAALASLGVALIGVQRGSHREGRPDGLAGRVQGAGVVRQREALPPRR